MTLTIIHPEGGGSPTRGPVPESPTDRNRPAELTDVPIARRVRGCVGIFENPFRIGHFTDGASGCVHRARAAIICEFQIKKNLFDPFYSCLSDRTFPGTKSVKSKYRSRT